MKLSSNAHRYLSAVVVTTSAHPESKYTQRHVHVETLTASTGPNIRSEPLRKLIPSRGRCHRSQTDVITLLSLPGAMVGRDAMT